jgi:hypothetical protein
MESRTLSIIDLNAELAKLSMFRGLTPKTTRAERRGSATLLGPYRDGILIAGKNAGRQRLVVSPKKRSFASDFWSCCGPARATHQAYMRRVLHQRVLEAIDRVGRRAFCPAIRVRRRKFC